MTMISRTRPSVVEVLLLRDRLGLGRYRKKAARDPEKRRVLLDLALERIEKAERDNFIPVGPRKRRIRSSDVGKRR